MSRVYSERFILGLTSTALTYTVPSGKRAVIKYASGANASGSAVSLGLQVAGNGIWGASIPVGGVQYASGLAIVAYAGEVIRVSASAAATVYCGGYLLDTV